MAKLYNNKHELIRELSLDDIESDFVVSVMIKDISKEIFIIETTEDVKQIGKCAFMNCINISEVNINGVEVIHDNAFINCHSLITVNARNLKEIRDGAFELCRKLEKVNSKKSYKIGEFAFCGCDNFKSLSEKIDSIKSSINETFTLVAIIIIVLALIKIFFSSVKLAHTF